MAAPIWQDYELDLGEYDSRYFQICEELTSGTVVLFSGKTFRKPGGTSIKLRINDVVANYVNPGYVSGISGTTITISGRHTPYIAVKAGAAAASVDYITMKSGALYDTFNPDWSYRSATGQTINAAPTLKTTCHRYQLVYVNSFGSWETFVIEGNTTQSDSVTRHTYSREYDNAQTYNRAKVDYCNELVHSYTFNTAFMNDAEAAEVPEILNSAQVYLYDAVEGSIRPLNITDTATEYKTYKGNGNKLSQYSITAELAQDRIRR